VSDFSTHHSKGDFLLPKGEGGYMSQWQPESQEEADFWNEPEPPQEEAPPLEEDQDEEGK
jgi:hypothetical protein